jgi:hypothetical protein
MSVQGFSFSNDLKTALEEAGVTGITFNPHPAY